MKDSFILTSRIDENISLRTIIQSDCENLRKWKNRHKSSFFFQEDISKKAQTEWFENYLKRRNDFLFAVIYQNEVIGCLGYRNCRQKVDIYNVILGKSEMGKQGLMSKALKIMCSYINRNEPQLIVAMVLRSNPSVYWYVKNNFDISEQFETYYLLKLNINKFKFCEVEKFYFNP